MHQCSTLNSSQIQILTISVCMDAKNHPISLFYVNVHNLHHCHCLHRGWTNPSNPNSITLSDYLCFCWRIYEYSVQIYTHQLSNEWYLKYQSFTYKIISSKTKLCTHLGHLISYTLIYSQIHSDKLRFIQTSH